MITRQLADDFGASMVNEKKVDVKQIISALDKTGIEILGEYRKVIGTADNKPVVKEEEKKDSKDMGGGGQFV